MSLSNLLPPLGRVNYLSCLDSIAAGVAKLADAPSSGGGSRKGMEVRVLSPAFGKPLMQGSGFFMRPTRDKMPPEGGLIGPWLVTRAWRNWQTRQT